MSELVSIIIPCYRQGHFLNATIDSVLSQTYPHREIIVVNDGSDDNTEEVALAYGDQVRYIKKPNGGLPSARNAGLEIAQGKYVHFLDSDDLLLPRALELMVSAMEGHEDRIVIIGYKFFEHVADEPGQRESPPPTKMEPFPFLLHGNVGPPNRLLMSRRMVDEAGRFNESLKSCEDWDMWLRLVFAGAHFASVREIAVCYRRHDANMTNNRPRMLHARSQVLQLTHRHFVSQPDLLAEYGNELLEAEHRVLRRWLATGFDDAWLPVLQSMIQELEAHGCKLHRSPARRAVDRALGKWSDRFALQYFRWFRNAEYQSYLDGCN